MNDLTSEEVSNFCTRQSGELHKLQTQETQLLNLPQCPSFVF